MKDFYWSTETHDIRFGVKVLKKHYEKLYNKKVIGITELENLVGREKINEYLEIGIVAYKEATKKVVLQKK